MHVPKAPGVAQMLKDGARVSAFLSFFLNIHVHVMNCHAAPLTDDARFLKGHKKNQFLPFMDILYI